jgi:hypothetical protein
MKWIKRLLYSLLLFIAGWLFNFVFDIQFALGVAAGWLMREGYDSIASALFNILNQMSQILL